MRSTTTVAVILALFALLAGRDCLAQGNPQSNVREQLSKQGFSGPLTGKVHIDELGSLHCGSQVYRVLFWSWEESNPPGEAVHAAHRLIFFDADRYIGSYSVEDRPIKLAGDSIQFSYPEDLGNRISCLNIGPGKKTVLNGEPEEFLK